MITGHHIWAISTHVAIRSLYSHTLVVLPQVRKNLYTWVCAEHASKYAYEVALPSSVDALICYFQRTLV
jgi:hypothetical protein